VCHYIHTQCRFNERFSSFEAKLFYLSSMRVSKITLIVLVCIIVLSIFVAKISNILAIKYGEKEVLEKTEKSREFDESLVLGDSSDHLMWFVQVRTSW